MVERIIALHNIIIFTDIFIILYGPVYAVWAIFNIIIEYKNIIYNILWASFGIYNNNNNYNIISYFFYYFIWQIPLALRSESIVSSIRFMIYKYATNILLTLKSKIYLLITVIGSEMTIQKKKKKFVLIILSIKTQIYFFK